MRRVLLCALLLSACSPSPEPQGAKPPKSGRKVMLFLGDSLTAGFGVAMEDAFPALLEERWRKEGLAWSARNAGVSGSTTAGILENLEWTLAKDVKAVFLCVGANDGLRGLDLESTRKNLDAVIHQAKSRGLLVILAGMKLPPNYGKAYAGRFEALYPELARRHGLELMPFLLDGVAGLPGMNLPDAVHPNEAGHRAVAENVHAFLSGRGLLQ